MGNDEIYSRVLEKTGMRISPTMLGELKAMAPTGRNGEHLLHVTSRALERRGLARWHHREPEKSVYRGYWELTELARSILLPPSRKEKE